MCRGEELASVGWCLAGPDMTGGSRVDGEALEGFIRKRWVPNGIIQDTRQHLFKTERAAISWGRTEDQHAQVYLTWEL